MTLIAFAVALTLVVIIAKAAIRFIGWPTSVDALKRWVLVLLGFAVFFAGLPELLHAFGPKLGGLPKVELTELVPALCVLGLAVLGYVGSRRAGEMRDRQAQADERTRFTARKRAAPPPPPNEGGFTPLDADDEGGE